MLSLQSGYKQRSKEAGRRDQVVFVFLEPIKTTEFYKEAYKLFEGEISISKQLFKGLLLLLLQKVTM